MASTSPAVSAHPRRPSTIGARHQSRLPALPSRLPNRLAHTWDLLCELVSRDLKVRYKRSALGLAWSLVNPIAQLLVFSFLFGQVLRLEIESYPSFVFTGVLAWGWFQSSVWQAAGAFVDNRQLIRRPGFASAILPAVTVTTNLIHYLLALPVLVGFIAWNGGAIGPALLALPVVLLIQYTLTLGLAYLVATSQVAFRDTGHLLGLLMMLLMYLTPVFYDPRAVPAEYRLLYDLNPMVHLIAACRAILMHGEWPDWQALGWVAVASGTLLALGYRVFARARNRFVEEL